MADISILKNRISNSGMTMVNIAKRAGIGRVTLYNRLNGKGDFTASEMMGLKKVLNLTDSDVKKIFF